MAKPERAVVTCMDYRVKEDVILNHLKWNPERAYFIRNAGGAVTQDVIRSLMLLQKFVLKKPSGEATYNIDIAVIAHTDCGMQTADGGEDQLRKAIEHDNFISATPPFALETFLNPQLAVRRGIQRLVNSKFVTASRPEPGPKISGYLYDAGNHTISDVITHVVEKGEGGNQIAEKYRITLALLIEKNPQWDSQKYSSAGQVLYIPPRP